MKYCLGSYYDGSPFVLRLRPLRITIDGPSYYEKIGFPLRCIRPLLAFCFWVEMAVDNLGFRATDDS